MNRGARLLVVAIAAMAATVAGTVVSQELREQPDVAALSVEEIVKLRNDIMKEDGEILIKAFSGPSMAAPIVAPSFYDPGNNRQSM